MDTSQIDKELALMSLKHKTLIGMKYYIQNIYTINSMYLHTIVELLQKKYTNEYDLEFIRNVFTNLLFLHNISVNEKILRIASYIYNYKNSYLLQDLLDSIGFNYLFVDN